VAGEICFWVSCIIHCNMPEKGKDAFVLASFFFFLFFNLVFVLQQLMLQRMLIFWAKNNTRRLLWSAGCGSERSCF